MAFKTTYKPMISVKIKENKKLVISTCSRGGYTIAQRMLLDNGEGKKVPVFLKGAIQIDDVDGLYNFRNALNDVIEMIEIQNKEE